MSRWGASGEQHYKGKGLRNSNLKRAPFYVLPLPTGFRPLAMEYSPYAVAATHLHRDQQAVEQNDEHDRRESHVEMIVFLGEAEDREDYASNGSGDQQQKPQLDDSAAVAGARQAEDTADRAQIVRLSVECTEAHRLGAMAK